MGPGIKYMANDDISPTLKWRSTGGHAPEDAMPICLQAAASIRKVSAGEDRNHRTDKATDENRGTQMETRVPSRIFPKISGEEERKQEKGHSRKALNNKISEIAELAVEAKKFLVGLDCKSMDEFMEFDLEEKDFDGGLHSREMYIKYKHWNLNGRVNLGKLRGFERKGFYTILVCDGCGWVCDMFPSLQRRYVHRKKCWMCRVKAKPYGFETYEWYQGQLNSEFDKMEKTCKDNRGWKHDYI